jgi:hypothetical protein
LNHFSIVEVSAYSYRLAGEENEDEPVLTPEFQVWLILFEANDGKIVFSHDRETLGRDTFEEILCRLLVRACERLNEDDVFVRGCAFGVYPLPS